MTSTSPYIAPLDGLRAVAVLAVIFYHLEPACLPGGYFGVDVFFVISGFLITGIIRRELTEGTFRLRAFFSRRVKRILPALSVELALTGILFSWFDPLRANKAAEGVRQALLLQGNLSAKETVGAYWGSAAEQYPFLHIWSLGVEEQFYLVLPASLLVLAWLCPGRLPVFAKTGMAAAAALSLAYCALASFFWPLSAFYHLHARAWELLLGGMLAWGGINRPAGAAGLRSGALLGASLVLASFLWNPSNLVIASLVPVTGALLLIRSFQVETAVARALASSPLVYVGRISYSLYLWHWPVVVIAGMEASASFLPAAGGWRALAVLLLVALAGWASYTFVERPLRAHRFGAYAGLCLAALAFWSAGVAADAFGPAPLRSKEQIHSGIFPDRPGGFPLIEVRGPLYSSNPRMMNDRDSARESFRVVNPPAPLPAGQPVRRRALVGEKLLVCWGDSHAMMLAPVLDDYAASAGFRADFHVWWGGDPSMHRPRSRFGDSQAVHYIKDMFAGQEATHAVLLEYERCGVEMINRGCDALIFVMRYHDRDPEKYFSTFDAILAKSRLIFVQQPPVLPVGDSYTPDYFAAQRDLLGRNLAALRMHEEQRLKEGRRRFEHALKSRYGEHSGFTFLGTEALFTEPSGGVRWRDGDGALLYLDDDHLTQAGARLIIGELARLLE